ncbi:iron chelate uptake ABC transporter family permease subunit [Vibrio cincinnatiensis]
MSRFSQPVYQVWRRGELSVRYSVVSIRWLLLLTLLVVLLAAYALTIGRYTISMPDLWQVIIGQGSSVQERIVWNIRLPRIVTAVFVGAALGVSGGIFQSVSRNALGSPDVIGFTTGAATGAIAQIVLFEQGPVQVALAAIVGGMVTAVAVYLLSRKAGVVGGYRLILTGIGIGSVLSALNGLMLVKGNIDNAVTANLWLAGSLHARTWLHAIPVMVGTLLLVPVVMLLAKPLAMIEMGDDLAIQLGIQVEHIRLVMLLMAVVLAAIATGSAGPIAFIALAAPQLISRLLRVSQLPVYGCAVMLTSNFFYNDYEDLQLPFYISARTTKIINAEKARTYGAEFSSRWLPRPDLQLSAGLGLLETKINKFSDSEYEGNELPRAPSYSMNFGADYTFFNHFVFSTTVNYTDTYYSYYDNDEMGKIDADWITNVQLAYNFSMGRATLFATNLFNSTQPTMITDNDVYTAVTQQPRLVGVSLQLDF